MMQNDTEKKKNRTAAFFFQAVSHKLGIIIIIIAVIALFFGGIRIGKMLYGSSLTKEKTEITETLLYQQLEQENELSTVKYFYTDMGKYENSIQVGDTNVPFTTKSFIISYDGIIKAGIDMDEVKITLKEKEITITIPEAQILSHEVDEDSIQVYDEKNSIFNGLSTEDVSNFRKERKEAMEQRAVEAGILEEAGENAKKSLQTLYRVFLENDEYEDGYSIVFVDHAADDEAK
jgi:hypothetical protein